MATIEQLITDNINVWSSAVQTKSGQGRGGSKKLSLYGIKKLRELILELAVRGLLVPQNSDDEPATVMLEKAALKKEQLFNEKKIKKPRKLASLNEDEKYYKVPGDWEWIRLEDVGHDWGQIKPVDKFTYVDVGAINKELGFIAEPTVLEAKNAPSRARKIVKKGTVIYSTVRPYLLNIAVIDKEFKPEPIASTAFAIIHPFNGFVAEYIYYYLRSLTFIQYVEGCQTGIAYPAINDKQFFSGLIPIPPTEEQHRIVSKVNELMTLCDQLEQQQDNSITAHKTLVETLLSALTNAANKGDFDQAWSRIAEHFDTLFTAEWSIDLLKQTILQLAVMGKLVPQDTNDEPASKLLNRVDSYLCGLIEKDELPKLARDKSVVEPSDFHKTLPDSWAWSELQDIALFLNGKAHEQYITENTGYILINSKFVSNSGKIKKYATERLTPLNKNDIAMVMSDVPNGRALARCYLVEVDELYTLNQRIGGLISSPDLNKDYLIIALDRNKYLLNYNDGKKQTNLKKVQVMSCPVPIPPTEEQHRIVAKVDELMIICNALKDCINISQITQLQLADAMAEQALT